ncbi:MAG: hypothetical protein QME51_08375 [Planctomycetota bacterium]|nr:hypothetical protein [Planctomycetota bacterium]
MNKAIIIDSLKKIDDLLLDLRKMNCAMSEDMTIGQLKKYLSETLGKCVYRENKKKK